MASTMVSLLVEQHWHQWPYYSVHSGSNIRSAHECAAATAGHADVPSACTQAVYQQQPEAVHTCNHHAMCTRSSTTTTVLY